jgi:anthraniloyl-CoA monooxygenase
MKKADPGHDVTVLERNRPDDTFGFGVVFSDATLDRFAHADPETHDAIVRSFAHWDDVDVHYQGQVLTSTGHGFAGMSRQRLLDILQRRCADLGVRLEFQTEVAELSAWADADLIVAADGVNSAVRTRHAEHFQPRVDVGRNKFVWLGTTYPFPAFTFIFKESEHGLWRVHAYRYDATHSTFILETTEDTWRRAGLADASEDDTLAFAERLFARELDGHRLLRNRSLWRNFPTVRNARWWHGNVVLVGDAAHTAHFSIGSGTKLAIEDSIVLARALRDHADVPAALAAYEAERRPEVESLQRAAQVSLAWFEDAERYHGRLEPIQFAFSLLTRSLRVTHENLKVRDAKFVESVDRWCAEQSSIQTGAAGGGPPAPPPMFTPFRLRELVLWNRVVVSPMCQYSADDGTPNDWHLVHLGSRAMGGAALVMAEMTDVSREGRISRERVAAWRRIVEFVHGNSRAAIGLQLAPGGDSRRDDLARAALMADEAGFDLLELHFAHGDPLDVFETVREAWPAAKPMSVGISATDSTPGGFIPADAVELARLLKARGCDIVAVSAETPFSDRVRQEAGIPTMTVGAVTTYADVNSIIAAGRADLCVLARAHLYDPYWTLHAAWEQGVELNFTPRMR